MISLTKLISNLGWLVRPNKTERDLSARPSDGLVVFSVMWGMATIFSSASRYSTLKLEDGFVLAGLTWSALAAAGFLIMNPRSTRLLLLVAGIMVVQYLHRMPVASNNQTIAFFMNSAICISVGWLAWANRGMKFDRDLPYEQLRVVARALLAIMYFYGIFHKINADFFNPEVSCAVSLYRPLAAPLGLDDNRIGQYLAIWSTFVVEAIALVCLYWRRFFWVGLIVGLPFHYVIPITGFSWYMDFSCLVFALYMLSVPREVASGLYSTGVWLVGRVPTLNAGASALFILIAGCGILGLGVFTAAMSFYPDRPYQYMWHSTWLLLWASFGGVVMLLIIRAAVLEQPYNLTAHRIPMKWWVYGLPSILFIGSASPYLGLKTESSIAMFSNLHTEGQVSNHLIFRSPPYLFDYQKNVIRLLATNEPNLKERSGDSDFGLVEHEVAILLLNNPEIWMSYELNGVEHQMVNAATFPGRQPNWLERKLLTFKAVDWSRPKKCTH